MLSALLFRWSSGGKFTLFLILSIALILSGCATKRDSTPQTKLVLRASSASRPPTIDGLGEDSVWKEAPTLKIPTRGGPEVTIKAAYTRDRIYLLASWADQTKNDVDEVWEFDGTKWHKGPYNDAFAIFWNINDSIKGFNTKGCEVVCHRPSAEKESWRMEIVASSEKEANSSRWRNQGGDIWDISLGISNVKRSVNDYYFTLDAAYLKYGPAAVPPAIFRQHDRFLYREIWQKNYLEDPTTGERKPRYMYKPGLSVDNTPYPTTDQVVEITDYSLFKQGDRLPFIIFGTEKERWGGSRDDIGGKGVWQDGRWTVEMERKLNTGHGDDIQFQLKKNKVSYYVFALAVFDHTIVGHYPSEPVTLEIGAER